MDKEKRRLMLLAAGFGTRMREYTEKLPKPVLPVFGIPVITYHLFLSYLWQVESVVVNVHYKKETLVSYLDTFSFLPVRISEEEKILGTAGGIAYAIYRNLLDSYFLVMNTDVLFFPEFDPYELVEDLRSNNINNVFFLVRKDPEHRNEKGFRLVEEKVKNVFSISFSEEDNLMDYYYAGIAIFHISFFDYYKASLQVSSFDPEKVFKKELVEVMKNQAIYGMIFRGKTYDIGKKESYEKLHGMFAGFHDFFPEHLHKSWYEFESLKEKKKGLR